MSRAPGHLAVTLLKIAAGMTFGQLWGCGTRKACKQAYGSADSPDWPIAELMGDFPAAAGVVTWRGGGLLITLTLFCMAELIVFRLTGVLNSDVGLHGRLNAKAKPTGVALLVSSGLGHS